MTVVRKCAATRQGEVPEAVGPGPVTVCVLTYDRPKDLEALLPLLTDQVERYQGPAEVLVVDNNPDGAARDTVATVDGSVRYVHEPTPGIAAARNRALEESRGSSALVFIDDDERPGHDWLNLLCAQWQRDSLAAVVGPVISEYDGPIPDWVAAGEFFRRRRRVTGTRVTVAATNNLLLDRKWVEEHGLRFDERFGLSGGSDTLFTRQLTEAGGVMAWNDEAVVADVVPVARLTPRWVLQRAFRSGNGWSRVELYLAPTALTAWRRRIVLTGRGLLRTMAGTGRAVFGTITRRTDHQAKGLRTAARGLGMLMGAYGFVYSEYIRKTEVGPARRRGRR